MISRTKYREKSKHYQSLSSNVCPVVTTVKRSVKTHCVTNNRKYNRYNLHITNTISSITFPQSADLKTVVENRNCNWI